MKTRYIGAAPIRIETKWHTEYRRHDVEFDEVEYVLTFEDGTSRTVHTFPNEWNHILIATSQAMMDASRAALGATLAGMA